MRVTSSWLFCVGVLCGCVEPAAPDEHPFVLTFAAESDPGQALAGVRVLLDGEPVGETDGHGILRTQRVGREGALVPVAVECPEGHRGAEPVPPVALRRFQRVGEAAQDEGIRVSVTCPPATRVAAVLVHADGHGDLPVRVGGQEVARTDDSGAAHFLWRGAPHSVFRVELDTSDQPRLRPRNPTQLVTVGDADDIALFDPHLVEERRRRTRRRRPAREEPEPEPEPEPEREPIRRIERVR